VVGFVGRLCQDKGIVELWTAWQIIAARYTQAELVILGQTELDEIESKRAFDSLKSAPRVTVISEFRDAKWYFDCMDLLVHPSHREGLPNVCLEAAAMALPVVTTDAVGCRDSVIDGVTGRIVPVGDGVAVAHAVGDYIDSPSMRAEHGAAGRVRVLQDFHPVDVWGAQSGLFEQMMAMSRVQSRLCGERAHD
jgi:glycosyltransferase involved in cell wall biosynthesis